VPAARIVRTGRQRPVSFLRGWARLALGWESMSDERRCLVIDAQPTVRLGVKDLLQDRYEVEEAEDGQGALEMLVSVGDFDVVIVELGRCAGGGNGDELAGTAAITALRRAQPGLGIVAHGPRAEREVATDAIRAGATAYVAKSSPVDALSEAVEAAADAERFVDPAIEGAGRRRPALTRRQRQTLQLLAHGHSTARAARALDLSGETVRTHTKAILARLGARDRAHAVALAMRAGLID
jgi:DNA-binding NarL/FixJ family response regulator